MINISMINIMILQYNPSDLLQYDNIYDTSVYRDLSYCVQVNEAEGE